MSTLIAEAITTTEALYDRFSRRKGFIGSPEETHLNEAIIALRKMEIYDRAEDKVNLQIEGVTLGRLEKKLRIICTL